LSVTLSTYAYRILFFSGYDRITTQRDDIRNCQSKLEEDIYLLKYIKLYIKHNIILSFYIQ